MASNSYSKVFDCVIFLAFLGVVYASENSPFVAEISEVSTLGGPLKAPPDTEADARNLLLNHPPLMLPDADGDEGRLLNDPPMRSIEHQTALVAHLDGEVHLVDLKSGRSHWSFRSGPPLTSFYQRSVNDGDECNYSAGLGGKCETTGVRSEEDFYIYSGEDWGLYMYSKKRGILKIRSTEEFLSSLPYVYGGNVIRGSKSDKTFLVNARNGEVMGNYDNGLIEQVPKDQGSLVMSKEDIGALLQPSNLRPVDPIYITRTDYTVMSVAPNNEVMWNVTVSKIEAHFIGKNPPSCYFGANYDSPDKLDMESENGFENLFGCQIKVSVSRTRGPKIIKNGLTYVDLGKLEDTQLAVQQYSPSNHIKALTTRRAPEDSKILYLMQKNEVLSHLLRQRMTLLPSNVPSDQMTRLKLLPSDYDRINENKTELEKKSVIEHSGALTLYGEKDLISHVYKKLLLLGFLCLTPIIYFIFIFFRPKAIKPIAWVSLPGSRQSNTTKKDVLNGKKRRTRRAGNVKSTIRAEIQDKEVHDKLPSEVTVEAHERAYPERIDNEPSLNIIKCIESGGQTIGNLFMSNTEIAKGSNGTVVFKGTYNGRLAAIKRLVRAHSDVASKEVEALLQSDNHPNIVRWFGVEYDANFVYLALELCTCNLSDLVELYAPLSPDYASFDTSLSNIQNAVDSRCNSIDGVRGMVLWKENGYPSIQLLELMRGMVSGLAHLHDLKIIHRDLKPHNVLISAGKPASAKLSDMGISKRLSDGKYSLTNNATGSGSSGWQAPEILHRRSQTFAVDLFSLGCVLFFCITKGRHPFGKHFERDMNIANNKVDLSLVYHIPEAVHLFSQLLQPDPSLRLAVHKVLQHPLLWSSERRLSFLKDCSDRIELEDKEKQCDLIEAIEQIGPVVFGGSWDGKFDSVFLGSIGNHRKYNVNSSRHLLRLIRNKWNHYFEFPKEVQHYFGNMPEGEGYDDYLTKRFPNLLIEVYKVIYEYCREETQFAKYFKRKN